MNERNDAKNQKISRGREECHSEVEREGLEHISIHSRVDGVQPLGTCGTDSPRASFHWESTNVRDTNPGKIVERLDDLKAKYLEYVDSHQGRLKARLEESKQGKADFLEEYNQIKNDIYNLAIARENNKPAQNI